MVEVSVWVKVEPGPVDIVPLPIATDALVNEPAPVIIAVTFAAAALFKVTAPVIVKALLMDNVAPDAEKVNEAALEVPLNVAVPDVFEIVTAPVVVNAPMLCVPVPLMMIAELPANKVPLLTKLPLNVSAKLLPEVLRVAPLLMVSVPLTAVAALSVTPAELAIVRSLAVVIAAPVTCAADPLYV